MLRRQERGAAVPEGHRGRDAERVAVIENSVVNRNYLVVKKIVCLGYIAYNDTVLHSYSN